jgi:hypothetical protein
MTYKILVKQHVSAYKNAGRYIRKTFGCNSYDEIFQQMETEFNLKSTVPNSWEQDAHCLEFTKEEDMIMFLLRWS